MPIISVGHIEKHYNVILGLMTLSFTQMSASMTDELAWRKTVPIICPPLEWYPSRLFFGGQACVLLCWVHALIEVCWPWCRECVDLTEV